MHILALLQAFNKVCSHLSYGGEREIFEGRGHVYLRAERAIVIDGHLQQGVATLVKARQLPDGLARVGGDVRQAGEVTLERGRATPLDVGQVHLNRELPLLLVGVIRPLPALPVDDVERSITDHHADWRRHVADPRELADVVEMCVKHMALFDNEQVACHVDGDVRFQHVDAGASHAHQ